MVAAITAHTLNSRIGLVKKVTVTSAQLLAINTTAVTVMTAPTSTTKAIYVENIVASKAAGTAYASVNDLKFYFTSSSGALIATLTAAGFIDQAGLLAERASMAAGLLTPNAPIVLTCGTGNPTTGTSPVELYIRYRIVNVPVY